MAQGDVSSGSQSVDRSAERRRTLISMGELKCRNFPSYFQPLFEEDIRMCLEGIETDILLGRPVQWDTLLPLVRAMRVNSETAPECLKFVMELLRLFERYQCKDGSVIIEVFIVMIFLTAEKLQIADKFWETSQFIYQPYGTQVDFLERSKIDLVRQTVRSANVGLLKLQLRFGLGIMTPYFSSFSSFRCVESLLCVWPNRRVYRSSDFISCFRRHDTICSVLTPESRKRHFLVWRVLEIVHTMHSYSPYFDEAFTKCYRLLFDSIPEAYVTSAEVKTFLAKYLPEEHSELIPLITQAFDRLLPRLADVPQPRSLQHLCKIQVRESLRQNLNLPHGVSSLPLPTIMKDYILLDDDGDYSIITRNDVEGYISGAGDGFWPLSYINVPEKDDCVTSFLKNL